MPSNPKKPGAKDYLVHAHIALRMFAPAKETATEPLVDDWFTKKVNAVQGSKAKLLKPEVVAECMAHFLDGTCKEAWAARAFEQRVPKSLKHTGRPRKPS
jgi:hypothetical protein